jgi:hypothetical protein
VLFPPPLKFLTRFDCRMMHRIPERLKMKDGGPPLPSSKEIFIYESKYNKEEEEQTFSLLFLFLILYQLDV